MAMLLSRSTWSKFSGFVKNVLFLAQNLFISNFLVQIRNQRLRLKIDPCAKFQPDWTKDKRIFFQSNIMPSLVLIWQQIKEKQRGHNVPLPSYMVPKYPSLNRVKEVSLNAQIIWNTFQSKQKNMANVACFYGQHFSCLESIKIRLVLLALAITLKGINTLRG